LLGWGDVIGCRIKVHIYCFSIIITIQKYKRKIEVPPIGEGPIVAPFKGANGPKVSKLAQRNVDFRLLKKIK
jgi:hypothetical protein